MSTLESNGKVARYLKLLLVVLAAGAIYPVIYLRQQYQETMLAVFDMSQSQLNMLYSVLGLAFFIGYVPSGVLSDRFSAKKLMVVSLLGVAAGGFWFAQRPSYICIVIIYAIWGIFSVFTFWGAHMKIVKMLSTPEDEGRFFGILDGGRGAVEAVLASIAALIFAKVIGSGGAASAAQVVKESAMTSIVYAYSIALVVVAILTAIFIKEDGKQGSAGSESKFKMSQVKEVFKNRMVLLMGAIIFLSYIVTWALYYYNGFLESNISVDAVTVGSIMAVVLWMRPVGGILGGFVADRIGHSKALAIGLTGNIVCLVLMSVIPVSFSKVLFYAIVIAAGIFCYAIRGTYWSLLGDCQIDNRITGTTIGVVSVVGYSSDIILPTIINLLFSMFGDNGGYNAYFIFTAILGVLGVVLAGLFAKRVFRQKALKTESAK